MMSYQQPPTVSQSNNCGCCEGIERLTPAIYNRPGLDALDYRAGTHGTFLETMKAALTYLALWDENGKVYRPLNALTARNMDDFSIALMDVWATIAEVLTFYQERIANEGYLQTARERRSVLELARLTGYSLRPGVAATVYLAYTVDESAGETKIPRGTRAQTVPAPGETMQSFETTEDLIARPEWNQLKLRMAQPALAMIATRPPDENRVRVLPQELYLQGMAALHPNEHVLFAFGKIKSGPQPFELDEAVTYLLARVQTSQIQPEAKRTHVLLQNFDQHLEEIAPEPTPNGNGHRTPAFVPGNIHTIGSRFASNGNLENPYTFDSWKRKETINAAKTPKAGTPMNAAQLRISPDQTLVADGDLIVQTLAAQDHLLAQVIYTIIGSEIAPPPDDQDMLREAYVFHKKANLFGHNAPPKTRFQSVMVDSQPVSPPEFNVVTEEWTAGDLGETGLFSWEGDQRITLDAEYEEIVPGSLIVLEWSNFEPNNSEPGNSVTKNTALYRVVDVRGVSAVAFGMTGKSTQLDLSKIKGPLWGPSPNNDGPISNLRSTAVYAVSEPLADIHTRKVLADEPLPNSLFVSETNNYEIELDHVYDGLKAGRWVTISGIRTDIPGGVKDSELAMLAAVEHRISAVRVTTGDRLDNNEVVFYEGALPGDLRHTVLRLAHRLNYTYQRDTVEINANVVHATHGETKKEILGNGNAAQPNQRFTLKQPHYPPTFNETETVQGQLMPPTPGPSQPLTFVPAATVNGIETTLAVRVNDVLWHAVETLAGALPTDHVYATEIDNEGRVTVTFGSGQAGSRLPTASENVQASYRVGIGRPGNVRPRQISLLATRPAGAKEVINPLQATGGTDPESVDQARRNAPLAVRSLDRLVSVHDYGDFARTFAGIGKSRSQLDATGRVLVIVGGEDNIPLTDNSGIIVNLREAFYRYGDPTVPVTLQIYEARVLMIGAEVRVHPDYMWEKVRPQVLDSLLKTFAYNERDFGQDVTISEVLAAIQRVAGVEFAQLTALDAPTTEAVLAWGEMNQPGLAFRIPVEAHQLAYADPKLTDLLFLSEMAR